MNELKKFLFCALGLTVAVSLTACDVEEECDEAGVCTTPEGDGGVGGAGGGAGGAGGVAADYDWVIVLDNSEDENGAGTPGADVCGISTDCGAAPVAALLSPGDGELCDSVREGCAANRADPSAAQDDGGNCEPASNPSDYVSMGMGGTLSVQFDRDLSGCGLTVVELVGPDKEGFDIYVCDGSAADSGCLNDDMPLGGSENGGTVTVNVP